MMDFSGLMWAVITVVGGTILLGAILAWGNLQSSRRRAGTGAPTGALPATGQEAVENALFGQGRDKPLSAYALRLGLPVVAAFALIAVVMALYM